MPRIFFTCEVLDRGGVVSEGGGRHHLEGGAAVAAAGAAALAVAVAADETSSDQANAVQHAGEQDPFCFIWEKECWEWGGVGGKRKKEAEVSAFFFHLLYFWRGGEGFSVQISFVRCPTNTGTTRATPTATPLVAISKFGLLHSWYKGICSHYSNTCPGVRTSHH